MPEEPAKLDETMDAKAYEPLKRPRSWLPWSFGLLLLVGLATTLTVWTAGRKNLGRSPESASPVVPPVANAADLPTRDVSLAAAAAKAACVVRASASKEASRGTPDVLNASTSAAVGNRTIHGGGRILTVPCTQEFSVCEVLHGKIEPRALVLTYHVVESNDVFPRPVGGRPSGSIPANVPVILLLSEKNELLKALRDTPENLLEVRKVLKKIQGEEPKP